MRMSPDQADRMLRFWVDLQRQYIDMYKKNNNKKLHRFPSIQKEHILSQKMNDNINMESTIAGSMNFRS
jgi:hypothetical protein